MDQLLIKKTDTTQLDYAVQLDSVTPISEEEFCKLVPSPAKTYPFELDVFQKQAVIHIEKGENVFVAAHTSAGKTVVAEYAIALAFSHKTHVIYTSPIKALSNQKFRDLKQEFGNVGIITGDVQLNPEAPCLIMTTEILLQMLYANSETINNLEFVIFDECHYVNDSKRGHVWEEVFILLPQFVKLVLLSATVPNVVSFSDWLGRTRQKKTYVVSTTKRPVPLKHYFYLGRDGKSQNQQILVLEGEETIDRLNHERAIDIMKERKAKFGFIKRNAQTERNVYLNLIRHLQKTDKLPVICFTLSRKKCDNNLQMLLSIKEENLFLTSKSESFYIRRFVRKHLKHLKESDLKLEQVLRVSAMLERGFGVHHSGVLPILKELTEILFSSGLVKVLFATETFAMGVNMPARTVVFDSFNKHDGTQLRHLKPAEYIQMAGRAGRRGKDTDGTVIILCKYDVPSLTECNQVMKGSAQHLESQFRLTYHMILNMLKSKAASIENFLSSSYREHSKVLNFSSNDIRINQLCKQLEQLKHVECEACSEDIDTWYMSFVEFRDFKGSVLPIILLRASDKRLLAAGRVVMFHDEQNLFRVGLLIRVTKGAGNAITELTLLTTDQKSIAIQQVEVDKLYCLLNKQIKGIDANAIIQENETRSFRGNQSKHSTEEAGQKLDSLSFPSGIELLLFAVDNFISQDKLGKWDPDSLFLMQKYATSFKQLGYAKIKCIRCKQFMEHYHQYRERAEVQEHLSSLKFEQSSESLELLPEYKQRIAVLQHLNFLDEHLVLLPKGHMASCISVTELLITHIIFENMLGQLSDEAIPAVLSCFVFDNKKQDNEEGARFFDEISELKTIMEKIVGLCVQFGDIEDNYQVYRTHFPEMLDFDPVRAVYEWAKGKSFLEIMKYTELQEGIMVRVIQRVDELIKNIRLAAKKLESTDFEDKLERCSKLIRRDIVFVPSLYTMQEVVNIFENNDHVTDNSPQTDSTLPEVSESTESNDFLFDYNFDGTEFDVEPSSEEQFSSNFI